MQSTRRRRRSGGRSGARSPGTCRPGSSGKLTPVALSQLTDSPIIYIMSSNRDQAVPRGSGRARQRPDVRAKRCAPAARTTNTASAPGPMSSTRHREPAPAWPTVVLHDRRRAVRYIPLESGDTDSSISATRRATPAHRSAVDLLPRRVESTANRLVSDNRSGTGPRYPGRHRAPPPTPSWIMTNIHVPVSISPRDARA